MSASLGRPCAIQEEEYVASILLSFFISQLRTSFDVDLPTEVDDEYWENEQDPDQAFKQPPGKPSLILYFVSFIKLNQILAIALRTIVSHVPIKFFVFRCSWYLIVFDQQIEAFPWLCGSALGAAHCGGTRFCAQRVDRHRTKSSCVFSSKSFSCPLIASTPPVKWDTTGQNFRELVWFLQSASLYSHYYHLQILVHRPFIPSPRKPSPLSFPSLAICTNAARSCAHVVDLQRRRAPQYPSSHFQARIHFVYVTRR